MPDWTYHPILRPLYRRLPTAGARAAALKGLGRWGASRTGGRLIQALGHTRPPDAARTAALGLTFPSPLGAGARLGADGTLAALASRLGVGFVELGPIGAGTDAAASVEDVLTMFQRAAVAPARVGIRLAGAGDAAEAARDGAEVVRRLAAHADFFTVAPPDSGWSAEERASYVAQVHEAARAAQRPLLVGVRAADARDAPLAGDGALVCGSTEEHAHVRDAVRALRGRWGASGVVYADGSAVTPGDALDLLEAGATLVGIDDGLAESGPGLPKRVHEALRHRAEGGSRAAGAASAPAGRAWVAMLLLGLGMIVAGALVWAVAATSVVLPYDEAFLSMTRDELHEANPRLLPFLAHDRITLAGTMGSIGVLYSLVAAHALRHGERWALRAIRASALVGFGSFFLFLAFGYFDPLHAVASLALLPFFLLGLRAKADRPPRVPMPDRDNDAAWRAALGGQLVFVALGVGLVLAGVAIMIVGSTRVFVIEDLGFLETTPEALQGVNERLLSLVAHDRAGFGGALVADGLVVLALALWAVRRGARWVWWALFAGGAPGFAGALGVHVAVGYLNPWHLAPAVLALVLWMAGLAALRPYLTQRPAEAVKSTSSRPRR